ncbi:hypothetical protein RHSIM_Rhsim02G0072200 [Rhododendron simsii]|uniref:Pectinesterase inhibitor domain-containing protein n=1 Tax=Rhododendron simsii TaxID=118357 RepID=A0A834HAA1_RHOSS|nr:hypothetical protein RHSIM_Rhsim02G0072200 [Rhododendron simsii]
MCEIPYGVAAVDFDVISAETYEYLSSLVLVLLLMLRFMFRTWCACGLFREYKKKKKDIVLSLGVLALSLHCAHHLYQDTLLLRSDPLSETADVKGLARIVLKVLLVKVNATLNRANDLSKESEDPVVKACLDVCASQYDDAIYDEIPEAIENLSNLQQMKLLLVLLLVRIHLMRSRMCVNRP